MNADITATPLTRGAFSKALVFSGGISIQPLTPILWDMSVIAETFLSKSDRTEMSEASFWLVREESDHLLTTEPMSVTYARLQHAMDALQILHPVGGKNIYAGFRKLDSGYDLVRALHPQEMKPTFLGRFLKLDESKLISEFDKIYEGILRAEQENIIRLQNPLALLGLGLQADHPYISTMLWMMGLDMLLMAGGETKFATRIGNLLGSQTLIFPKLAFLDKQPDVTVSKISKECYSLRNVIAHGSAIPSPFLEPYDFVDTNGESFNFNLQYHQVLSESSLFMLTESLRMIFLCGLVDEVKSTTAWRRRLGG